MYVLILMAKWSVMEVLFRKSRYNVERARGGAVG